MRKGEMITTDLFLFLILLYLECLLAIRVDTTMGSVDGLIHDTSNGPINVFLSIPYATAQMFEEPQPILQWNGVHNGTKWGYRCHQTMSEFEHFPGTSPDEFNHDCLSFSILTPNTTSSLPVFFWIHGGAFEFGDAHSYGYTNLAEYIASKEIVVVMVQYRLGPYGFFSLGDDDSPGNMGLWDVKVGLEVARKILPSFGADINKITVVGHSAGAAIASTLLYSKHTKDLFDQAIILSGSHFAGWNTHENVVKNSQLLAEGLGCLRGSSKDVKKCMREKTNEEILEKHKETLGYFNNNIFFNLWNPRYDNHFLGHSIKDTIFPNKRKNILSGTTSNETFMFIVFPPTQLISSIFITPDQYETFNKEKLKERIQRIAIDPLEMGEKGKELTSEIVEFVTNEYGTDCVKAWGQFTSDLTFNIPSLQENEFWIENGWKTFYYSIEQPLAPGNDGRFKGAWHGSELRLFTDYTLFDSEWPEEDMMLQIYFTDSMANFVKNGDPSTDSFKWPPASPSNTSFPSTFRHTVFQPEPRVEQRIRFSSFDFWNKMINKYGAIGLHKIFPNGKLKEQDDSPVSFSPPSSVVHTDIHYIYHPQYNLTSSGYCTFVHISLIMVLSFVIIHELS